VDVRALTKHYGATTALEPTDLAVSTGEFLTLLGPSGSGKTTLLMMIAGLTDPSGGTIAVDGVDVTRMPAYRRDIGVVFQSYALFPHMTVAENVAFPLRMRRRGGADIEREVQRALDVVRLGHLGERLPRELSGGQQQRVAFARAIVFKPAVVLMDEPLGALDKKLREELKLEIRKLHRDLGVTIIYVTHDQEEAMLLSDRICLMNNARVEQIDTPMRLYEHPSTQFAADFIGESNILAVVADGARSVRLGEHTLQIDAMPAAATHERSILIRPERVRVGARSSSAIAARVTSIIDLGGTRRITADVPGAGEIRATLLGGEARELVVGAEIGLHVSPRDVVVLADAETSA
jgi:putative spermidine/putrescine transport system ATP-binding protein